MAGAFNAMKRTRMLVSKNLTGRKVLLLFVLTNLVYAFMLLVTIPKTMSFSGGMKLPDMMPLGYDLAYVNTLLDALGEKGRDAYLYNQLPVDMVYPFLFGIGYCLLMAWFLNKLNKLNTPAFFLCLLPLVAGLADYLENAGLIVMLNSYGHIPPLVASATSLFSVIKSSATTVYFIALLITLAAWGTGLLKKRGAEPT